MAPSCHNHVHVVVFRPRHILCVFGGGEVTKILTVHDTFASGKSESGYEWQQKGRDATNAVLGRLATDDVSHNFPLIGTLIFSVIWTIGVTVFVTVDLDGLLAFLEKTVSRDGQIEKPIVVTLTVLLLLGYVPVVFLTTFKKWGFPVKYLPWYLAMFGAHFVFFTLYTNIELAGLLWEDSLLEWGTVALALIASVLFFVSGTRGSRFAWVLGMAWLLFALEEISWGQRLFGIESPELFLEYNYQQETNFHNFLNPVMLHLYVGFNLFLLLFFTWFRQVQLLSKFYKLPGISDVLRVNDKFGLWIIPLFLLFASFYPGREFVEEQWALFGVLLSSALLRDLVNSAESPDQGKTFDQVRLETDSAQRLAG